MSASPRLVLINGAPGSGKSTLAAAVAAELPMALQLDIDQLKFSLGGWRDDLSSAGLQARRLTLALVAQHLGDGHDVIIGQYLPKTAFIEQLEHAARGHDAEFVEIVLQTPADVLAHRLAARHAQPTRPEHEHNNTLVGPDDAADLVASIEAMREHRPAAITVNAAEEVTASLTQVRSILGMINP